MKTHVQELISAPTLVFSTLLSFPPSVLLPLLSLAVHQLSQYRLVFRNRILIGLLTVFRFAPTIGILIIARDLIVIRFLIVTRLLIITQVLIVTRVLTIIRAWNSNSNSNENLTSGRNSNSNNNSRSNNNSTFNSNSTSNNNSRSNTTSTSSSNSTSKLRSWKRRSCLSEKRIALMGFRSLAMKSFA